MSETNLTTAHRGEYGELSAPEWVSNLVGKLNGTAWTIGLESLNKRGGFEAINWDCYGYTEFMGQQLCVIQLRRAYKRKSSHFLSIRKDYYLCGHNENGNPFAHPIDTPARSRTAMATVEGPVLKALAEIWRCDADDLADIRRNGDVAFVPASSREIPSDCYPIQAIGIAGSHVVEARKKGRLYFSPSQKSIWGKGNLAISHAKGQHPAAITEQGCWRVRIARRAEHWGFTAPTAD